MRKTVWYLGVVVLLVSIVAGCGPSAPSAVMQPTAAPAARSSANPAARPRSPQRHQQKLPQ